MPDLAQLAPVALIVAALWAMTRYTAAQLWHLLAGVVLGVILSGTILGPDLARPVGDRAACVQPAAGRPGVLRRGGRHAVQSGSCRPGGRPVP